MIGGEVLFPTSDYHTMTVEDTDTSKTLAKAARQRDDRKLNEMLIIDSDCHHFETEALAEIIEFLEDPVMKQTAKAEISGRTERTTTLIPGNIGNQVLSG